MRELGFQERKTTDWQAQEVQDAQKCQLGSRVERPRARVLRQVKKDRPLRIFREWAADCFWFFYSNFTWARNHWDGEDEDDSSKTLTSPSPPVLACRRHYLRVLLCTTAFTTWSITLFFFPVLPVWCGTLQSQDQSIDTVIPLRHGSAHFHRELAFPSRLPDMLPSFSWASPRLSGMFFFCSIIPLWRGSCYLCLFQGCCPLQVANKRYGFLLLPAARFPFLAGCWWCSHNSCLCRAARHCRQTLWIQCYFAVFLFNLSCSDHLPFSKIPQPCPLALCQLSQVCQQGG